MQEPKQFRTGLRSSPRRASRFHDLAFYTVLGGVAAAYALLILLMLVADIAFTSLNDFIDALSSREIRYAAILSLCSATVTCGLCLWVATPTAYLLSRGSAATSSRKSMRMLLMLVDSIFDLPIVLPPLVVGVSLLILFKYQPFASVSDWVVYEIPAVILAQFVVACAFSVRTMRATFDQIPKREEQVALTLGASRAVAFWRVTLPRARQGLLAAATMSWARALGEFGPILVFASTTRLRTEVLPTTVYLEMQAGNLKSALAVSMMLITLAATALILARCLTEEGSN